MPDSTLAQAFAVFRQSCDNNAVFENACELFITFDGTQNAHNRLIILYNLYALYAELPLEMNPFLTFFLEFLGERGNPIEKRFVRCILDGTVPLVKDRMPSEVYADPEGVLPVQHGTTERLKELQDKAALLVGEPTVAQKKYKGKTVAKPNIATDYSRHGAMLAEQLEQIENQASPSPDMLAVASQLMEEAGQRTLTLPEQQFLQTIIQRRPNTVLVHCKPLPDTLRGMIEANPFLAFDVAHALLKQETERAIYLETLTEVPISSNSLEMVHHLLTCAEPCILSSEFMHVYISNSIRSCEMLEDGPWKDKQVRTVAKFLQSLLEKKVIGVTEYLIEIQSFCVGYFKFAGVAALFRFASCEAQPEIEKRRNMQSTHHSMA
ncbi:hypothetical protein BCR43DRAFT_486341 [Syncephalastrum racemosum]|uniref:CCR4-NOT transcription complex subunit 11 n=1 Tax=Syncephalastrum racemosum TaxID=13706 RepID=A0A1X2HNZ9_SYNRA|nr:hypothetical protein BCR43DRAFT_486341 [Syncephalastrum racemosum]